MRSDSKAKYLYKYLKNLPLLLAVLYLLLLLLSSALSHVVEMPNPNTSQVLLSPSSEHLLGTDALGRDLLHRVLMASGVSLTIGLLTTFGAFVIAFLACFAGIRGPRFFDQALFRLIEVAMALPSLVMIALGVMFFTNLIGAESTVGKMASLTLALIVTSWFSLSRQIRTILEVEQRKEYILSAQALGASPWRIFYAHLLPNIMVPLLVLLGLQIPNQLLFESFLTFTGIGLQPPVASWGVLIQEGWKTLSSYPHLILVPSGFLFLSVLSLNLIFESFWRKS